MRNLTKAFAVIYLAAMAIGLGLMLWVVIKVAIGYLMYGYLVPAPPIMPWFPIAVVTMYAAKYAGRRSARRNHEPLR